MCLLPCRLLKGPGGLLGLGSVHTCLAFSVVDAVKTLWLFKNNFMFLFSIGNPIHFFNPIKLLSGQKVLSLKMTLESPVPNLQLPPCGSNYCGGPCS